MDPGYDNTLERIREAVVPPGTAHERLQHAMELINQRHAHYEWVGIYVLRGDVLHLGPYVGKSTEHTRIPVGKGVCGTAVAERADQVIEDVTKIENYIACSSSVRSEIVVLIWDEDEIIAQLDADCDEVGAFGADDEAFLHQVAAIIGSAVTEMR